MTRAAENTVFFASCNACLVPHQNSRSYIIAPDGQTLAVGETVVLLALPLHHC